MPHQSLLQGSSNVKKNAQSGRNSARILKDIADTTKSSYLQGLAGIGSMIFETIENVKSNREKCLIMTEQAYELICAVINCCEDAIKLVPAFLHSISILTLTFQKVVSFMQDHAGGSLVKSSSSVSVLLPAAPKIFHGRQHELEHVINALTQNEAAQVAILGPGGIGKTSLAHATLHHFQIMEKFGPYCYWIACDSSESANDLIVMISTYFGINV
ncbi:hypothetical protein C8J56DRAFT_1050756 [Mycena floridula]|nr:hypothetical protein C8J56DRAFT_1050756 [Mycena floridula]